MLIRSGVLFCGAVERAADQVQVYCKYSDPKAPAGTVPPVVLNALYTLNRTGGIQDVLFNWAATGDAVIWSFSQSADGKEIDWKARAAGTVNAGTTQSGKFISVFGAP